MLKTYVAGPPDPAVVSSDGLDRRRAGAGHDVRAGQAAHWGVEDAAGIGTSTVHAICRRGV